MGRPRKYETEAERQAAFRERQRDEVELSVTSGGLIGPGVLPDYVPVPIVERPELRAGREEALALGRRYGEDEATRRGEEGEAREQRVARAVANAAWEFDGKPDDRGDSYRGEFGIKGMRPGQSVRLLGSDQKQEKEKRKPR